MMPKQELLYFGFPGRAEAIRTLFHIGGIDFDDTRFKGADWPTIKPTTPLGSVPVLRYQGRQYCQSVSIARYAAKLAGWYPVGELDALTCDMVAESINELSTKSPRVSRTVIT
jgi:glutathione S-transferase